MNRASKTRRGQPNCARYAALLVCFLGTPGVVLAQLTANPYASVQVEHDNNVFRVPNSSYAVLFHNDPTLGDTDERYIAGLIGTYLFGRQTLVGTLEGRELQYQHYTGLDHSEYLVDLALTWKLLSNLDGLLEYRREREAAPFENGDSSNLELNTDQVVKAKLNYTFTPDWRLETGINNHELRAPLQFYTDFTQHETTTHAGLVYLGVANLTYGVGVDHLDGSYSHAVGVGPYSQNTRSFNFTYKITGLDSIIGNVGYAQRHQTEPAGNFSATTGGLSYIRQLTGKTTLTVQFLRNVNSYLAAGGSEIDTSGTVGLNWLATYKLSVGASYGYMHSVFIGEVIPGSTATGRIDNIPTSQVYLTYNLLRQFEIKGYYNRQVRSSNDVLYTFDDTTVGVRFKFHWR